jgi:nitrite reductase/ring-hydroxylating ferredoxin subunit
LGEVTHEWSGQVLEPTDSLAFIGRNPMSDNVYIVTGDSGHGMTHSTIGGLLITDLILGRQSPYEKLYDPTRKPKSALKEFANENLNVALQYTDWIGNKGGTPETLNKNDGCVVTEGLRKVAYYRDEDGSLHKCSAVCPHLGCIVSWNSEASSWDCPCHGSRFDPRGKVLNGPAITPLEKLEE